ncbi:hypothetical protein DAPPUDRAFT_96598 [Daphnia pulex]|uniref:Uncharacterized protein n=1 Tax=Daphnia pulex TaxID=6669 RepID=E9FYC2_DAPPU|nr:hypothetical protein DAPPUDRAFT_96598 [Daphnia pulex]|eukprot:EFX87795.1 hypothetical protein DAPPUDRAFT_96598 [Daphnia pulex]
MKNTPENDEAFSDHESGIASTVPPSPIHYFPPAVRQAAFNSRSSSHSSMGSFNRGHLSEADHQQSRPSTPMSFAPPESIALEKIRHKGGKKILNSGETSFNNSINDIGWTTKSTSHHSLLEYPTTFE